MTDLYPGQLVVCVDDSSHNRYGTKEIVRGRVYTIRAVVDPDPLFATLNRRSIDEPGVLLLEVRRETYPDLGEVPFGAYRFRPLGELSRAELPAEEVPA